MKTCFKCKLLKDFSAFYPEKGNASGYASYCKECNSKYIKQRQSNKVTKAKDSAKKKQWYLKNRQRNIANTQLWIENNRARSNATKKKYGAAKINRTPTWLSAVDFERIETQYKLAEILTKLHNEPWHVDHVIPLQGKLVSGLHVPSNLQVIRGRDNCSKNNTFLIG
jgi:hypothetical protein